MKFADRRRDSSVGLGIDSVLKIFTLQSMAKKQNTSVLVSKMAKKLFYISVLLNPFTQDKGVIKVTLLILKVIHFTFMDRCINTAWLIYKN